MKALDRILQDWRIRRALPFVRPRMRVLDVGCADGTLLCRLPLDVEEGIGLDPELPQERQWGKLRLLRGSFPGTLAPTESFDVITALAVFEHVPPEAKRAFAEACAAHLKPGGLLVLTVPSPLVDPILDLLKFLRLADGMELEQHHHFDVRLTSFFFSLAGCRLVSAHRFQLGLNNLFVFQKRPTASTWGRSG